MNKTLCILFILLIVLTGCNELASPNKTKEIVENKNKYDTTQYMCLVDGLRADYKNFNRDDIVEIVGSDDDYYYVNNNYLQLAVKKDLVRLENEKSIDSFYAFTANKTFMFSDISLSEILRAFNLNEQVKVLDVFSDYAYIEVDGIKGYVLIKNINKNKYTKSKSSSDGEDITLNVGFVNGAVKTVDSTTKGYVLADGTKGYINIFAKNDIVEVLQEKDNEYIVVINGRIATVEKGYITKQEDYQNTSFNAYTKSNSKLYSDVNCDNVIKTYKKNDTVKVYDVISDVVIIEIDNKFYYMYASDVSKTKFTSNSSPAWTEPVL